MGGSRRRDPPIDRRALDRVERPAPARYPSRLTTSEPLAVRPEAVPVRETVDFAFAFSVSSTRIERVNEPPGSRAGICCLPGLTRTPVAAFTLRVPFAVAVPPVLEILTFTVFDLPTFSFSAFDLPIESTGGVDTETAAGAGVEGPEV